MSASTDDADWYRVATLYPRLRDHIVITRHRYRGHDWYVIRDPVSGRHHRVDSDGYRLIANLDGDLSVEAIWEKFRDQLADEAPTRSEFVKVLTQLGTAGLIQTDRGEDIDAASEREREGTALRKRQRMANPLLLRFPLFDPDRLLQRLLPLVRPLMTMPVAIAWVVFALWAFWQVLANWSGLATAVSDKAFSPFNLVLLFALYPLVKAAHEIGHGLMARRHGCEVHELGVALLVFIPLPYVDVSAVNSLANKIHRIQVTVAGIVVELSFAGFGLWLWLNSEPGIISDIGLNLLLLGGVSSLLFNGNPLLKYDGYYILADLIEIPALYERSTAYLQYLLKRYLLRVEAIESNVVASGERGWFIGYGIVSLAYRLLLMWTIAFYIAGKFFIIGVVLAIFLALRTLLLPLYKALMYLAQSPQLSGRRTVAWGATTVAATALVVLLSLPMPSFTTMQGVVWLPEESQVRAPVAGWSGPLLVAPNARVTKGTALLDLSDPLLNTRLEVAEARLTEMQVSYRAALGNRYTEAENVRSEMVALQRELEKLRRERDAMAVKAPGDGLLVIADAADIEGQYFDRGELIGFVVRAGANTARIVVPQSDAGKIEAGVTAVQLQLASAIGRVLDASITRRAPDAVDVLPSPALAASHGGQVRTRRNENGEEAPVSEVFQYDLQFEGAVTAPHMGERVYVRMQHADESIFSRLQRRLRQTFLKRLDV